MVRVRSSAYRVCQAPAVARMARSRIQYAGCGTSGPNHRAGSTARTNRPLAMNASMFFAIGDHPLLMTRSENGSRVAGKSGLRMPPVSPNATNISRNRGIVWSVSPRADVDLGAQSVQLRDSQRTNIPSEAVNVAASARTRGVG